MVFGLSIKPPTDRASAGGSGDRTATGDDPGWTQAAPAFADAGTCACAGGEHLRGVPAEGPNCSKRNLMVPCNSSSVSCPTSLGSWITTATSQPSLASAAIHSCFNLVLDAASNERTPTVQAALSAAFERYGLPEATLCDNGGVWGRVASNDGRTPLSVWLLRLGVRVLHGRPHYPQTQGKEERFHRTPNAELLPPSHLARSATPRSRVPALTAPTIARVKQSRADRDNTTNCS